jgi:phage baseplate assembly protein W
MSSTNQRSVPHIIESMTQILKTGRYERPMEYHIYSDVDSAVFEPNDVSSHTLLAYQVAEALKLDPRIEVLPENVKITSEGSKLFAEINFKVLSYNTSYNAKIEVGEYDVNYSD